MCVLLNTNYVCLEHEFNEEAYTTNVIFYFGFSFSLSTAVTNQVVNLE